MQIKINEIASLTGGNIVGNSDLSISNLSNIQDAKEGDLSFLYMPSYLDFLSTTRASAVLIPPLFEKLNDKITYIEVDKPNLAFQKIINTYFKPEFELNGVDESAHVSPSANICKNTSLGKNVVIGENSKVGENNTQPGVE